MDQKKIPVQTMQLIRWEVFNNKYWWKENTWCDGWVERRGAKRELFGLKGKMERQLFLPTWTSQIHCDEMSHQGCFGSCASPTHWGKCRVSRQNARKPLHQVKLNSNLGGLCTRQECSGPQSKHLGMVSSALGSKGRSWARRSFSGKHGEK